MNIVKFYVYVLRSCTHPRNYTGFTKDVELRLKQHNAGETPSTKPYRPWNILLIEEFESKIEAINREKFLKSGQGRDYIKSKIN